MFTQSTLIARFYSSPRHTLYHLAIPHGWSFLCTKFLSWLHIDITLPLYTHHRRIFYMKIFRLVFLMSMKSCIRSWFYPRLHFITYAWTNKTNRTNCDGWMHKNMRLNIYGLNNHHLHRLSHHYDIVIEFTPKMH